MPVTFLRLMSISKLWCSGFESKFESEAECEILSSGDGVRSRAANGNVMHMKDSSTRKLL